MTGENMEALMVDVATKIKDELSLNCSRLDAQQKTAAKAYNISIAVIDQAIKMVNMKFTSDSFDEKYYRVRESRIFNNPAAGYFNNQKVWFNQETNCDLKNAFLVYAHAVQMVRSAFYDKKTNELANAKKANAVEKIFECTMVIDTLKDLLEQWGKLWKI